MVAFNDTFMPDAFSMMGSGEGLGGPANMASAPPERLQALAAPTPKRIKESTMYF